jgi:hypothetical protein
MPLVLFTIPDGPQFEDSRKEAVGNGVRSCDNGVRCCRTRPPERVATQGDIQARRSASAPARPAPPAAGCGVPRRLF